MAVGASTVEAVPCICQDMLENSRLDESHLKFQVMTSSVAFAGRRTKKNFGCYVVCAYIAAV